MDGQNLDYIYIYIYVAIFSQRILATLKGGGVIVIKCVYSTLAIAFEGSKSMSYI